MAIKRHTVVLDAAGQAPGRLATQIATILMGKNKPDYVPHIDSGDKVEVINAKDIVFTGKKLDQKVYRHHTNHPGGLKETGAKTLFKDKPEEVVRLAVIKMLPKNKLRTARMKRLKIKK